MPEEQNNQAFEEIAEPNEAYDPTDESGDADGTGQGEPAGKAGGAGAKSTGAGTQTVSPEEFAAMKRQMELAVADRDKFSDLFRKLEPKLATLDRMGAAFGDTQKPDDKIRPPQEIIARLNSPDRRVAQQAFLELNDFYGKAAVERELTRREKEASETTAKQAERGQRQNASFDLFERHPTFTGIAKWAKPKFAQLQAAMKFDENIRRDHAWLEHVPEDIFGSTYAAYQMGSTLLHTMKENPALIPNVIQLMQGVSQANQRGMDSRTGAGGVNPGVKAKGGGDVLDEIAGEILSGSGLG